ncbi:hypothetical protein R3P38DRAFT_2647046 [Favolaschia claudopus]|uniref:HSF-type DNA-binding domain-containing protein n=1 Tax=Favolaschia claudopus TaxID=2862362 RepID=A0AAW0AC22_9AGAR
MDAVFHTQLAPDFHVNSNEDRSGTIQPVTEPSPPAVKPHTASHVSSSHLFEGAAGFKIAGGHFASGNVTVNNYVPQPNSTSTQINCLVDDSFSESEIYCKQLMRQKRGFPLYDPKPRRNLTPEYRESGVAIGDVGRITAEGAFDFFFNIYLSAEHPINNHNVPENFYPLAPFDTLDVYDQENLAGSHVSTSSVQRLDPGLFPGGDFILGCQAPQGAVLALPEGSHLQKLENLEAVREYAAANAEEWFKYINGPRGRQMTGPIYLITGCEKATSWGMATFHSVTNLPDFQLTFRPIVSGKYRWTGNPAQKKFHDPTPLREPCGNQTLFLHGFSISLATGIWGRISQTIRIGEADDSSFQIGNSISRSLAQGSSITSQLLSFFQGGTSGNYGGQSRNVVLQDFPPSEAFHPGSFINKYLFEKIPNASVVISHDDNWQDVFEEENSEVQIQFIGDFIKKIEEQNDIVQSNGLVFLQKSFEHINRVVREARNRFSAADLGYYSTDSAVSGSDSIKIAVPNIGIATNTFVAKLYQMINDPESSHFIFWTEPGTSFVIRDPGEFCRTVLSNHFKHNNFSSFVRQMNKHGFQRINRTPRDERIASDAQMWEFSHHKFLRGRPDLLNEVKGKIHEPDASINQIAAQSSALRARGIHQEMPRHSLGREGGGRL